jgi:hypothetical protein
VGLPWVGVAAKQGPAHVVLWLVAIVLFYLPSLTLLFVVLSILPIVQVESTLILAIKISSVIVLANVVGIGIFQRSKVLTFQRSTF